VPRFETELVARGGGVVAEVPDEVMAELGGRRVAVVATVNGHSWRTTTAVYGGLAMVGLNKTVQATAGVSAGDRVELALERDDAPREVVVPETLAEALVGDVLARETFSSLAYTHRKEYAEWIAEAKRPETRERARRTGARDAARPERRSAEGRAEPPPVGVRVDDPRHDRTITNQRFATSTSPEPSSETSCSGSK